MLRLIPPPLHRAALRAVWNLRNVWRRLVKPRLAGVCLILTDSEGRVMLVRHSYGPAGWALPGGGCDSGERAEDAARREMREELGCELDDLVLIRTEQETLAGAPHTAYIFTARLAGDPQPDGREIVEVKFFAPDALPAPLTRIAADRLANWRTVPEAD